MTKLSKGQKWVFAFLLALGSLSLMGAVLIVPSGGGGNSSDTTNAIIALNLWTNDNGILKPVTNASVLLATNLDVTGRLKVTQSALFTGPVTNFEYAVVRAGKSGTNAFVGGLYYQANLPFTNLNATPATLTNLGNVSIAGNTLTNVGDAILAIWGGKLANALANTNNFQIVYGSETILDTGLQIASNTTFRAEVIITRTGLTSQHAEGYFSWGPGGAVPFVWTNTNVEITQTNGIETLLALRGASQRVGAHTNNSFRVYYEPGVR